MSESSQDLTKFLRKLRAVREYTGEDVSPEAIEDILEVGRWTSTGGNRQPTEVIVIRDPAVKTQFGEWGAKPAATAALVLLLVSANEAATLDEGRMAERLALAAAAHGLGSCIATLKEEGPEAVKSLLGIPEDRKSRVLVAIGHTDVEARRVLPKNPQPRKPMEEYAHRGRF